MSEKDISKQVWFVPETLEVFMVVAAMQPQENFLP